MELLRTATAELLALFTACVSCFPMGSRTVRLNNKTCTIDRLLGEGGFSYVYLVTDRATGQKYALKKILCRLGPESVDRARHEIAMHQTFRHKNIMPSIDQAVLPDRSDGTDGMLAYILMPYYRLGTLQDMINEKLVSNAHFSEPQLLTLVLGLCRGLKEMHQPVPAGHRHRGQKRTRRPDSPGMVDNDDDLDKDDDDEDDDESASTPGLSAMWTPVQASGSRIDETAQGREAQPLMEDDRDDDRVTGKSYFVHRDIKPANIIIDQDGVTAVIMDLGSVIRAPVHIPTRHAALVQQDIAAEHSTMPYRAPELFQIDVDQTLTAKSDIWSVGCTLFACLVGKSPFEARAEEVGGSLDICIQSADWRFPDEAKTIHRPKPRPGHGSSNAGGTGSGEQSGFDSVIVRDELKQIVRQCLVLDPDERADIDEIIELTEYALKTATPTLSPSLQDDGF